MLSARSNFDHILTAIIVGTPAVLVRGLVAIIGGHIATIRRHIDVMAIGEGTHHTALGVLVETPEPTLNFLEGAVFFGGSRGRAAAIAHHRGEAEPHERTLRSFPVRATTFRHCHRDNQWAHTL